MAVVMESVVMESVVMESVVMEGVDITAGLVDMLPPLSLKLVW